MFKPIATPLVFLATVTVLDTSAAHAQGAVTFRLTNNSSYTIYVKMYSRTRNWVWPNANNAYVLNDRAQHAVRISCRVGEQICFGGSWSNNARHWGVGLNGKLGCQSCCLTCGTLAQDPWHAWNLVN